MVVHLVETRNDGRSQFNTSRFIGSYESYRIVNQRFFSISPSFDGPALRLSIAGMDLGQI